MYFSDTIPAFDKMMSNRRASEATEISYNGWFCDFQVHEKQMKSALWIRGEMVIISDCLSLVEGSIPFVSAIYHQTAGCSKWPLGWFNSINGAKRFLVQ